MSPTSPHKSPLPPIADLKADLVRHLPALAEAAFGSRNTKFRTEVRYGSHGSIRVWPNGGFRSYESGEKGGILEIFALAYNIDPSDTKQLIGAARRFVGDPSLASALPRPPAAPKPAEPERSVSERIKHANATLAASVPLDGTPGEKYLTVTRSIPTYPSILRWNPRENAIVVPFTAFGDDKVFAVAMLGVDANGGKTCFPNTGSNKKSRGLRSGRCVLFRGTSGTGPIYVCEGIETALTVWCALGGKCDVVAAGGTVSNLRLPRGRSIVICRDDDPDDSPSHRSAAALARDASRRGGRVAQVFPFIPRRKNKNDFNNLVQEEGLRAVRMRLEAGTRTVCAEPNLALSEAPEPIPAEAVDAAIKYIPANGGTPPLHIARTTVGTGKTFAMFSAIAKILASKDKYVVIAGPEHRLNDQICTDIIAKNDHAAGVWRGREASQPDSTSPMCAELRTVNEASKVLADIDKDVCKVCPNASGCAYLAQKALFKAGDRPRILLISHQILRSGGLPGGFDKDDCAALFVDESPIQSIARAQIIPASYLELPVANLKLDDDDKKALSFARSALFDAIKPFFPSAVGERMLIDIKPGDDAFRDLFAAADHGAQLEYARKLTAKDVRDWRQRTQNGTISGLAKLFAAFQTCINGAGDRIWLKGARTVSVIREENGAVNVEVADAKIAKRFTDVPIFVSDALANKQLLERAFARPTTSIVSAQIDAPHQTIYQETSRTYSKQFLSTPRNREAILSLIRRKAGRKTLVVGNKDFIESIRHDLPVGCVVAHFNAVAGKNDWQDADVTFVIGRPSPSSGDISHLARAYGSSTLETSGRWPKAQKIRREIIDGGIYHVPRESDCADDPITEALRELIADGQIEQAVGRPRGIRRTSANPCTVYILGQCGVSFPVVKLSPGEVIDLDVARRYSVDGHCIYDAAAEARMTGESARTLRKRRFEQQDVMWSPEDVGAAAFRFRLSGQGRRMIVGWYDPDRHTPDQMRQKIETALGPVAVWEAEERDAPQLKPLPADEYEPDQALPGRVLIEAEEHDADMAAYMQAMGYRPDAPDPPDDLSRPYFSLP